MSVEGSLYSPPVMGEQIERARRTLEGVVGFPATEANQITGLHNGCEIFPAMLDAIRAAEHTVDFLTFVYWNGEIGTELAEALGQRAKSGERVRVLHDAWESKPIEHRLVANVGSANFHALPQMR